MSVQLFQGAEILAPFSVSSEELLYSVKGLNLSEERLSFDSQCFNFSFNISAKNPLAVFAHVTSSMGTHFDFTVPQYDSIVLEDGLGPLSFTLTSAVSAGATSLAGLSIPVGRFFTFSNHSKLYLSKGPVSGGSAFFPPARQSVPIGATVAYGDNVVIPALYSTDQAAAITFKDGIMSDVGTITLREFIT